MIDGQRVLAVIPARGGSKGVPGKNIREAGGKPLIAWTIEAFCAPTCTSPSSSATTSTPSADRPPRVATTTPV